MNKILEENYVENLLLRDLRNVDYLNYDSVNYVSNMVIAKLIGMIKSGSFNRFGEVLEYNIDTSLVREAFLEKTLSNIYSLRLKLMVVKVRDMTLIIEAEPADGFYGFLQTGKTLAYIDNNLVWINYFSNNSYSNIIEKEIDALSLTFVNTLERKIVKEVSKYVSEKLPLMESSNVFKSNFDAEMKYVAERYLTGYSFLKSLDDDLNRILTEEDYDSIVLNKIDDMTNKLSLTTANNLLKVDELVSKNSINIDLYINDNEKFWSIIESNIEYIMTYKAALGYAKIKFLESKYKEVKNIISEYNLIKEYNIKTRNMQREINDILDNKCKTIAIEYDGKSIKTKSDAMCIEKTYSSDKDYIELNNLCFSLYGGYITVVSPTCANKFVIKSRNTVIYESKDEDIEYLTDVIGRIKDSQISEIFNIHCTNVSNM